MEPFEGIVMKQIAFKESSVILHVYGATGMESVMVHGAKKWNSAYLRVVQPFTRIKYHAAGKDLKTLTDADILDVYPGIQADLERSFAAGHLLELVRHHAEGGLDHAKLYPFLVQILKRIDSDPAYSLYVMMFELKLYYLIGVQPRLNGCVVCGQTENLKLSVSGGGACCPDHQGPDASWGESVIDAARTLYYHDIKNPLVWNFEAAVESSLRDFLDQYTLYHLHLKTKSRQLWMGLHR